VTPKLEDVKYKSIKVKLHLTKKQKNILNNWIKSCICMYNATIDYIIRKYGKNGSKMSYITVRNKLKHVKKRIIRSYNNSKNKVKTHIMDETIKMAVTNYKTASIRRNKGEIKRFRIRKWRQDKTNVVIKIEKGFFKSGSICKPVLGLIKATYNNVDYDLSNINATSTLRYNRELDEYMLFVPLIADAENDENANRDKFISIDPGVRTVFTGISEKSVIKMGDNVFDKYKQYLTRLDNTEKIENINKRKKKQRLYRRKISNLTDELHWKCIRYIVDNYDNVLIGNMSSKSIVSTDNVSINKMTKRVLLSLRLYDFKKRLQYKCSTNNVGYAEVNESYTSKICSNCGWLNDKLGSSKVFSCEECKKIMDRDVNGARGIFMKHLI
jgi:putative transposase